MNIHNGNTFTDYEWPFVKETPIITWVRREVQLAEQEGKKIAVIELVPPAYRVYTALTSPQTSEEDHPEEYPAEEVEDRPTFSKVVYKGIPVIETQMPADYDAPVILVEA